MHFFDAKFFFKMSQISPISDNGRIACREHVTYPKYEPKTIRPLTGICREKMNFLEPSSKHHQIWTTETWHGLDVPGLVPDDYRPYTHI